MSSTAISGFCLWTNSGAVIDLVLFSYRRETSHFEIRSYSIILVSPYHFGQYSSLFATLRTIAIAFSVSILAKVYPNPGPNFRFKVEKSLAQLFYGVNFVHLLIHFLLHFEVFFARKNPQPPSPPSSFSIPPILSARPLSSSFKIQSILWGKSWRHSILFALCPDKGRVKLNLLLT